MKYPLLEIDKLTLGITNFNPTFKIDLRAEPGKWVAFVVGSGSESTLARLISLYKPGPVVLSWTEN